MKKYMLGLVALVGCVGIYSTGANAETYDECRATGGTACNNTRTACHNNKGTECDGAWTTCLGNVDATCLPLYNN